MKTNALDSSNMDHEQITMVSKKGNLSSLNTDWYTLLRRLQKHANVLGLIGRLRTWTISKVSLNTSQRHIVETILQKSESWNIFVWSAKIWKQIASQTCRSISGATWANNCLRAHTAISDSINSSIEISTKRILCAGSF